MSTFVPDATGPAGEELARFVRETLGCTCPDEVFERVEIARDRLGEGRVRRVAIGGRLLLELIEDLGIEDLIREIPGRARSGRMDRDAAGMNRFRLVVGLDQVSEQDRVRLTAAFASGCDGADDRVHLHLVSARAVPPG